MKIEELLKHAKIIDVYDSNTLYNAINSEEKRNVFCLGIKMDKGILNIENKYEIKNDLYKKVNIEEIIGKIITDTYYKEKEEFVIYIGNRIALKISLKEQDFNSPEAFCFYGESGEIIVGN